MKKHFLLAAIMVPFLAFVGYALTDWYLKKDRQPGALTALTLTETPCVLSKGCTLTHQDFVLTLRRQGRTLHIQANQRLKGVIIELSPLQPPARPVPADSDGYRWTLPLITEPDSPLTLHLVAQSHWRNYIGELAVRP